MKIAKLKDINAAEMKDTTPWKPIKTAPKDKRILVVSVGRDMYVASWAQHPVTGDEAFIVAECDNIAYQLIVKPTHWMELPEPPEEGE